MNLKTLNIPFMDENAYLISGQKGAIIIDPGQFNDEIKAFIEENSKKEFAVLLTHNHFDHIMGAAEIKKLTNARIIISEADAQGLCDGMINLADRFCVSFEPFSADAVFNDNDCLFVGDIEIKALVTPGHTQGSSCFIIGDWMFSGDTLFRQSIGRTDFTGGDRSEQIASLKRLSNIKGEYEVYPGHGPATRLSYEKQYNPYIKEIL